ncbi:uncharacterized protein B0P05DRAFT_586015 [Gilbertella persicaria]|uniref:uncharacterized protein n=1 Tax=Gilbertella persicaria TaxID=101096 RepID=UPI00221ED6BC|nr:uncharacterized protein B0P05DRAFT_586015 [Gilbertella persicaria]KAI8083265.1 hypothetical protein B0P05DRAFT_586015 [Gilbertella persicaria]
MSYFDKQFNQARLAALSNYKLAIITFTPTSNGTLRKTALIKNLIQDIYQKIPFEYIDNMVRWEFFRPELFESVTQDYIEKIIHRYLQIIYNSSISQCHKDQQFLYLSYTSSAPSIAAEERKEEEEEDDNQYYGSLFSQSDPNILSMDSFCTIESDFEEEMTNSLKQDELYPFSIVNHFFNQESDQEYSDNSKITRKRASWKGDSTDISTITLASELMNLFDMDFNVDLSLPGARKHESFSNSNSSTSLHNVYNAHDDDEEGNDDDDDGNDDKQEDGSSIQSLKSEHCFENASSSESLSKQSTRSSSLQHLYSSMAQNTWDTINQSSHSFSTTSTSSKITRNVYAYYFSSNSDIFEEEEEKNKREKPLICKKTKEGQIVVISPPGRSSSLAEHQNQIHSKLQASNPPSRNSSPSSQISDTTAESTSLTSSTIYYHPIKKSKSISYADKPATKKKSTPPLRQDNQQLDKTDQKKKKQAFQVSIKKITSFMKKSTTPQEAESENNSKSIPSEDSTHNTIIPQANTSIDVTKRQKSKRYSLFRNSIASSLFGDDQSNDESSSIKSNLSIRTTTSCQTMPTLPFDTDSNRKSQTKFAINPLQRRSRSSSFTSVKFLTRIYKSDKS